MQNVTAKLKYLHIAPRKVRFVADVIRGISANEAEAKLFVSPRRPAKAVLKLLRSAMANASNNFHIGKDNLFVKEIRVDQGPMFKRWTPRARGSGSPIQKKTSHISLTLGIAEKAQAPKFTFPKKVKKSKKQKTKMSKQKTEHKEKEQEKETIQQKPARRTGFFQKVFRRKSV